jgi:menaquinone reductase, multiheme cytochrome c subunit
MSAIFPKYTDRLVRIGGAVGVLVVGALAGVVLYLGSPTVADTGYAPLQPVPYSHKMHAGNLGIDCRYCHYTVEKAAYAAIPPTEVCMNCHVRVKPQSEQLVLLRETYLKNEPVPWVRVHRLPDYVYFNHEAHVNAGVSCVSCHGRVDQMVVVKKWQDLSMTWCLDCHRNPAPNIRPAEYVTKLDWKPDGDPAVLGARLIAEKGIHPPTNCSGCHR